MKKNFGCFCWVFLFLIFNVPSSAQVNGVAFFEDDRVINIDLSSDFKRIISKKELNAYQPATVTMRFPDSTTITEEIKISARGEFRRLNCYMPTLMLDFRNPVATKLSGLKRLKLVCGCGYSTDYEKLLLKEYLAYKMYNLLTDMSFRVRLVYLNYSDTKGKIRPHSQYGFLIEGTDEMAKRNKCREVQKTMYLTEKTNRQQMTMVAIFQYMIGNTDWAVPNYHNVKLMRPRQDSISAPYVVPYDFDFCGLVNAHYASPAEGLDIRTVKQRSYRGFPRNPEELQLTLDVFRNNKKAIEELVTNFELLPQRERKEIMDYIEQFYKIIENKKTAEAVFIENARQT